MKQSAKGKNDIANSKRIWYVRRVKTRTSLLHAFVAGSALVVLPALFVSACSPDEKVNPAPVETGASSSSATSSGVAGEGGRAGAAGSGGNHQGGAGGSGGASSSSSGGMAGSGGMASSSSSSSGQTGGVGGMGSSSSSSSSGQTGGVGGIGSSSSSSGIASSSSGIASSSSSIASSSSSSSSGFGGAGGMLIDAGPSDAGVCPITTMAVPVDPGIHVVACSPITYSTNPPTSGSHYPSWAAFKWYTTPVPRGYSVHAMEHGAIVISYNCPNGCAAELADLAAFLDARPADPMCIAPLKLRVIVTPDPLIDTKFAAAAWGAFYKGNCFDFPALGAFFDMYYAKAPENFCFDGTDVTSPDAGTPADCGSAMDAGTD